MFGDKPLHNTLILYIYRPNSIFLPTDLPVKRIYPNSPSLSIEGTELDTRTVFYDIFIDPDTKCLRGIGPRLLNLKDEVFPLKILVENRRIDHSIFEVGCLVFLQSEKPLSKLTDHVSLTFEFKDFKCSLKLNISEDKTWLSNDQCNRLTISTLQKDNPTIWIEDWIRWHCRLYGVKRIILYDNGSRDRENLTQKLRKLEPEVEVIFVHWDFPYGYPFNYVQYGSLNHCRSYFLPKNKIKISENNYCINLDIDEYLVSPHRNQLLIYLDSIFTSKFLHTAVFNQVPVTNVLSENCEYTPRCIDFKYVYKEISHVVERSPQNLNLDHPKYIYRFSSSMYNEIHHTKTIFKHFTFIEHLHFYIQKLPTKLNRRIWGLKRFLRNSNRNTPKPQYDAINVSASEMYFFHFHGLTCKWSSRNKNSIETFDETIHTEEKLIEELFHQADLQVI